MDISIGEILGYLGAAGGGGGIATLFNWRYNKKKNAQDIKADEIENIRKSVEVYQTIISDQNKRILELNEEVQKLREDRTQMEKNLTAEIQKLREDKSKMEDHYQHQLSAMQKQITELYRALGVRANKQARNQLGQYVKTDNQNEYNKDEK